MLPTLFSLLAAIAGWHYMFYSQAASRLASVEVARTNRRRIHFRRAGGMCMLLLGVLFYTGCFAFDLDRPTHAFFLTWLTVFLLLLMIIVLGVIDMRLTLKLRRLSNPANPLRT